MSRTEPCVIHEEECELEGWEDPASGGVRWRTLLSGDRTPTDSLTVGVAELEPGEARHFRAHRHGHGASGAARHGDLRPG
jgi:hypothetical protein